MDYILQIGKKIKSYRTAKGLTVKELAAAAQITSSMLSQIERGQANPSLNTIRALANELDIPLFKFFVDDISESSGVVHPDSRKHIIENGVEYELLTEDMNCAIEFCQLTLEPGKTTKFSAQCHKGEEVAMVLSGCFELSLNEEKVILSKGDSIKIAPEAKHYWTNAGTEDAVLVFAVTPPSF